MTEELTTLITMVNHRAQVSVLLKEIARQLERRADLHDLSKFGADEFKGFVQISSIAREYSYGCKEYMEHIKDNNVIDLHFSRNRHHPEYHTNEIEDMTFIDFIEMVCDWLGATAVYSTGPFEQALEKQIERFSLTSEQLYLINLIASSFENTVE